MVQDLDRIAASLPAAGEPGGAAALTIEKFAVFDQFPYTHHLECGAIVKIATPNPRAPTAGQKRPSVLESAAAGGARGGSAKKAKSGDGGV